MTGASANKAETIVTHVFQPADRSVFSASPDSKANLKHQKHLSVGLEQPKKKLEELIFKPSR